MSAKPSPVTRIHPNAPARRVEERARPVQGPRVSVQELRADPSATEAFTRIAAIESKAGVLMPFLGLLIVADLFFIAQGPTANSLATVMLGGALAVFAQAVLLMFSCLFVLDLGQRIETARAASATRDGVLVAASSDLETIARDRRERFVWAYGLTFTGFLLAIFGVAFSLMH